MTPSEAAPQALGSLRSKPSERVLFRLQAQGLDHRWLARTARLMAWLLTAYACIPFLFVGSRSQALGHFAIWQNLVVLSWLAGLAALVVAAPQTETRTLPLARLRGVTAAQWSRVEWATACHVPFKVLAPAGLVMSTLATAHARSWADISRSLLAIVGVAGYTLVAAGVLGMTALWSRRLSPQRGRTLFIVVVLLPLLLERAISLKSLPTVLGELLQLCLRLGNGG